MRRTPVEVKITCQIINLTQHPRQTAQKSHAEVTLFQHTCDRPSSNFHSLSFLPIWSATHSTVLCHVDPLITNALGHCLLPPPHSETASVALGAHFLLQAPKPCHICLQKQLSCLSLGISLVVILAMCPHHEKLLAKCVSSPRRNLYFALQ